MKVGVIADSHGNLSGLVTAIEHMRGEEVSKIFHLGHEYIDVQNYINMRRQILSGKKGYDDTDFVSDFGSFLLKQDAGVSKSGSKSLDEVQWLHRNIVQVPAADEAQYSVDAINNVDFEMVSGKFMVIVHNPKDLSKEDIASANIILYGHSHKYQVDTMQNRYFINPGHLQTEEDNKRPASYAILDFQENHMLTIIYSLSKEVLLEKKLESTRKRKFSIT